MVLVFSRASGTLADVFLEFFVVGKLPVREGSHPVVGGAVVTINWLRETRIGLWGHPCSQIIRQELGLTKIPAQMRLSL